MKITISGRVAVIIYSLGALLLGAAAPLANAPFNWPFAAVLSMAGLYGLISISKTGWRAFLAGWFYGLGCFGVGISWVHVSIDRYGGLPLVVSLLLLFVLCAYLALFPAIACFLWRRLTAKQNGLFAVLLFAGCWALAEMARGEALTGFPWLALGYSDTAGLFSGWAAIVGVEGISYLLALCAALLILLPNRKTILPAAISLALVFAASLQLNDIRFAERTGDTAKTALVQGNVPLMLKWEPEQFWPVLDKYQSLTRPYYDHDFIIWPEAAIPSVELVAQEHIVQMDKALKHNETALISGVIDYRLDTDNYFNTLIVMGVYDQDVPEKGYFYGNNNRYSKHHLLPIGEYVPFEELLRPIAPLFNLPHSSFSAGAYRQSNLVANGWRFAPAICYEILFPDQVRKSINNNTDFILTVSNDTWFGDSIGPHQHLEIAKMRALELQRPVIRATNDGITTVIDIDGEEIDTLPQFTEGVLSVEVARYRGLTPFSQWGHWPVLVLSALSLLIAVVMAIKSRLPNKSGKAEKSEPGRVEPRL